MSYATNDDLVMRFGQPNLNKWADLEGDGSSVTARIAFSLQYADDMINSTLNGKWYKTPLVFTDSIAPRRVAQWAVVLAGHWLYFCRGQLGTESEKDAQGVALQALYASIIDEMQKIACGAMILNGVPKWSPNTRAPAVITL